MRNRPALATQPRAQLSMRVPALLMFASGGAALVFQVLWVKQLSLVVGVEVYAVTTAISAFFAGLALGGLAFGRWADRLRRPVRLYAGLELLVALLGVGATFALAHAAGAFARLEASLGLLAWLLPFALVGLPAFFMGGTLPVLVRALKPAEGQLGRAGGGLYAANTAGAIAGTLLAAFVLLPALGVLGSACAAAGFNLLAVAGALLVRREAVEPAAPAGQVAPPRRPAMRLAIALYCVAGGVALGYEVVWTQSIVQFMSTRAFAFAVVLATYLCGLVLGSALYARRADRLRDPWGLFGLLIAAAGLLAILQVAGLGAWLVGAQTRAEALVLGLGGSELAGMCARFAVAALCVVFLPTILLGAAFPLALRLAVDSAHVGRDVGRMVALNTLGGILSVMFTGFVLVPGLGLVRTLALLAALAAAVGLLAVWRGEDVGKRLRLGVGLVAAATLATGALTSPRHLAELLPAARHGQITFYQEGRGGTVAVVEQGRGQNRFSRLYIQGVSNTGDAMPSLRYMRLQALLPLLAHDGEPRSALVIGFGTGITAGAMLRYQGLQHPVVAELLPEVLAAAPHFKGTFDARHDPRLDIRLRDGRRELLRSAERYDMITLEPPPPSAAGVVNLYSRDFYQLAASRLEQGGIVAQWLPLPTQNEEDSRALVRSFIDVFPHAWLWTTEFHEMLLVGSPQPLRLDVPRIRERFAQPEVSAALAEVGVDSPEALLATWVTDRAGLESFAGEAPPVTDDQPRIEYAPWVRAKEITRVLPALLALRHAPPLEGAEPSFRAAVDDHWARLRRFYDLSLHAYRGDRQAWARDARQVVRDDGENPYYRWFLGAP
ncbi:putative membrane-bound spermidine synthase [Pseudomonas citronellolis]|uniref:fused MFS/spermidine synthase n=1 Tax=Pseudomonas citronellolis TaxID=53408 RepID=UPI00209F8736|nr:fused MFS/spermidine synthase [Pseudomonas citronellolis]MCP1645489.1 putative membrane-bound spermidine synthase [Pseudomonas citronellolis]MCP1668330.1 putative membrane-bound spermidine synthase [Pseudomonas citronellolis]MCP1700704.1 putative membrane-bound spermidine synthase [Pseudomonas citronellolis]MCP1706303.1 putative membrane-bound spermidine synthase [Pseudomonas citronellolis]MCP1796618.1 putative membrane-bound spermidine synthase [Pseudomonas citronellolis]